MKASQMLGVTVRSFGLSLLLSGAFIAAPSAGLAADNCLGDVSSANSCTANDMNLANAHAGNIVNGCTNDPNDTATFDLLVDVQNSGQNQRYDVGVFVADDGGDAFHGTCKVAIIPPANDDFVNLEGNPGDTCGDSQNNSTLTVNLGQVTVPCLDVDKNGFLDVNGCVSWDNNTHTACNSAADAKAGTPSKCDCSRFQVTEITVPPDLCDPANDECDDGLVCNGVLKCKFVAANNRNECVLDTPAPDCDDHVNCTIDGCTEPTGQCTHANNDSSCEDDNACTAQVCNPGAQGSDPTTGCVITDTSSSCDDNNPCTDDSCDAVNGCVHTNNTASCNDGNACTTGDTCSGGICVGGAPPNCDDGNVCTTDSCVPTTGCAHENNTNPCSDGNACTTGDTCSGGSCVGGAPPNCDDGNVCTTDSCVPATGCAHANNTNPCDDGNACTTGDTCSGGSCAGGAPPNCDDGNVCTTDSCVPATGCAHANNTNPCSDGNACTTNDTCSGGGCVGGPPPNCNDNNPCTDDSCNAVTGCGHVNNTAPCDDNTVCNGHEVCSGGTCRSGTPLNCNDNNPCTDDACNAVSGCGHTNNTAPCSDAFNCTDDQCSGGHCVSTPNNSKCNDGILCTKDTCDPTQGCQNDFDAGQDVSCTLETCRTPGFWATHGDLTNTLLGDARCLTICGEVIDDIKVKSADSALEAMCVPTNGSQQLQLARQLTAAALNCIASSCVPGDSNADCSNSSIAAIFSECNTTCANKSSSKTALSKCIAAIDCYNNGGMPNLATGSCRTGSCAQTAAPCGTGFPRCQTGDTCVTLDTNCELQPLVNADCGIDFDPPGNATTSQQCNDATKSACTVVGSGENSKNCSENTDTCVSQ